MKKLLIANRGEISVRIAKAAREQGIMSVAVYEAPDQASGHVRAADEAICIGDDPLGGYLDIETIVETALSTGCDALHPGYGFLSENPELAEACQNAGVTFVGPSSDTIRALADKVRSRGLAQEAGLPNIPSSDALDPADPVGEAAAFGRKTGYPLMLKAVSGGGGRGIRRISNEGELESLISLAQKEALAGFGDPRVFLEKCIERPIHVEVQVMGDATGRVIHLGTRNCSVQRRHQKLLEFAPAGIDPGLEAKICDAAVAFAEHVGYLNAGTVEFLVDQGGDFYFMEMNTRLQVEHPITELYTGVDIVGMQLMVATGDALPISQDEVSFDGWAIEARLNAEDPTRDFMPELGKQVNQCRFPQGPEIRVDTAIYNGYRIPVHYDSLLAKVIVHGRTWPETLERMQRALTGTDIDGLRTTLPILREMTTHPEVIASRVTTAFLDDFQDSLLADITADGSLAESTEEETWAADHHEVTESPSENENTMDVRAQMPGIVEEVLVSNGEPVSEGRPIVVVEAMKMFCNIESPADGTVLETSVAPGQHINADDLLARIRIG